jgi:hypothetical protein
MKVMEEAGSNRKRIVSGCVNANGTIHSGSGFSVVHAGTGFYVVTFDEAFAAPPSVTATQQYKTSSYDWGDFTASGGSTLDNVVIVALDRSRVKLKCGNSAGIEVSRNFCFIAIGE